MWKKGMLYTDDNQGYYITTINFFACFVLYVVLIYLRICIGIKDGFLLHISNRTKNRINQKIQQTFAAESAADVY